VNPLRVNPSPQNVGNPATGGGEGDTEGEVFNCDLFVQTPAVGANHTDLLKKLPFWAGYAYAFIQKFPSLWATMTCSP